ncbi:MAG TPA: hypothetical protein VFL38_12340, partial [Humibacillus xanthopallidus]|nr:hypothetical protein [Humibacillus xanthopallidus]
MAGLTGAALVAAALAAPAVATTPARTAEQARPVFTDNVAHDTSRPLSDLARAPRSLDAGSARLPEERGAPGASTLAQRSAIDPVAQTSEVAAATVGAPVANFEGLSNQDNFNIFGGRVNPPDPVGDVGPNHYVEMVNLTYAVYSKTGTRLLGPVDTGTLWQGFAVPDCTDPSGDPIVLYDQLADRWILSQFTTRGLDDPSLPFYNCIAVSTTGDPTGSYYRYAFTTGANFPDYPKYGVWTDSYVITTREFGPTVEYGIGVYGLEKNKMLNGQPARAVSFYLDSNVVPLNLIGDGLLPADIDGKQKP